MKKIFIYCAIFFTGYGAAHAQTTTTASQTITLTLQNVIDISITASTGVTFNFDNISEYQNGMTNSNASTFSVKSNRSWNVTVKTASANFTGPASPAPVMPSSKLGVRVNGISAFAYLTTSVAALTSGVRGINTFNIDYNAIPGFDYDAGTYTISVVYTATQQ
jgi:hypothetical protein